VIDAQSVDGDDAQHGSDEDDQDHVPSNSKA
jgi:hypothetical protein